MTGAARFCPQCGAARTGALRFCGSCGLDFDGAGTSAAPPRAASSWTQEAAPIGPTSDRGGTAATLAGVAWLLGAALLGYLAFIQLEWAQVLQAASGSDDGLRAVAAWNGLAAILTAYFGARCLRNPDRGLLNRSIAWAALNVVLGAVQVADGGTSPIFYGVLVASGVAGVLSFVAREDEPSTQPESTSSLR